MSQLLKPLQRPGDRVHVHRFPPDMAPGASVSVELGSVTKHLLNVDGLAIRMPKSMRKRRQPRFSLLEMSFSQTVIAQELRVNLTTSEVFLIGRVHSPLVLASDILVPQRSTLTTYYARNGKRKLLNAYFQGPGHPFINIDRVFESYDRVYCVDTNTAQNGTGHRVAVTTALAVTSKAVGQHAMHIASEYTIQLVANDPPPGNPEVHGIWLVLLYLKREHPQLLSGRLAIITDTEYARVREWQERTQPFYGEHHLPEGVDIFYATADAGSDEFMPNRLMRACDSLSAQKLRHLLAS